MIFLTILCVGGGRRSYLVPTPTPKTLPKNEVPIRRKSSLPPPPSFFELQAKTPVQLFIIFSKIWAVKWYRNEVTLKKLKEKNFSAIKHGQKCRFSTRTSHETHAQTRIKLMFRLTFMAILISTLIFILIITHFHAHNQNHSHLHS